MNSPIRFVYLKEGRRKNLKKKEGVSFVSPLGGNRDDVLESLFDSFIKTTIKNSFRDIKRKKRTLSTHELLGVEEIQFVFENQKYEDIYPSENIICDDNIVCEVADERLYTALMKLKKEQRDVIILDFWYGMTDREISSRLKVSERTVYNRRKKAFQLIKKYY